MCKKCRFCLFFSVFTMLSNKHANKFVTVTLKSNIITIYSGNNHLPPGCMKSFNSFNGFLGIKLTWPNTEWIVFQNPQTGVGMRFVTPALSQRINMGKEYNVQLKHLLRYCYRLNKYICNILSNFTNNGSLDLDYFNKVFNISYYRLSGEHFIILKVSPF